MYDLGKKAAKSDVGNFLVCKGPKKVRGVYKKATGKIKNEKIGNDLHPDLANTGLNYRLGYAYDRFK